MNDALTWNQVNITFPGWDNAERTAAAMLARVLGEESAAWFFIRKHPCWRVRYQLSVRRRQDVIRRHLDELVAAGHITGWTPVIYEPETCAFGGPQAMTVAHRLFCADSRCLLGYLRDLPPGTHRRELSLLLCSVMMRAASQDWYEQGDIWARVASLRKPPPDAAADTAFMLGAARRLLTADAESQTRDGAPLARHASWAAAYETAGRDLAALAAAGRLHRGLRDVLAHHVIFAWNRLGLPYQSQSALAGTAKTAVFGPDPAIVR